METKKKSVKRVNEETSYLVKTKGYKETFNSLEQSRNQFDILKKRAIKNKADIKIQIFVRKENKLDLLDEVVINSVFYEE